MTIRSLIRFFMAFPPLLRDPQFRRNSGNTWVLLIDLREKRHLSGISCRLVLHHVRRKKRIVRPSPVRCFGVLAAGRQAALEPYKAQSNHVRLIIPDPTDPWQSTPGWIGGNPPARSVPTGAGRTHHHRWERAASLSAPAGRATFGQQPASPFD